MMKLAAAQIQSIAGDISQNMEKHLAFSTWAAQKGADLIVFPELSLTGYEPALAQNLTLHTDDVRMDPLQDCCNTNHLTICVGFPSKTAGKPKITMAVFQPGKPRAMYSKKYLHEDEVPYFEPGGDQLIIKQNGLCIAPAICYESRLPEHGKAASALGADIYLASVAKPERGLEKAFAHYPKLCQDHQMCVLMSNAFGPSDGFISAGMSGAWDERGNLAGQLDAKNEGLLLFDTPSQTAEVIYKTS